eukprot:Seg3094.2 transcript_id=Seg3094.2/GoldUCD/mRNA.D3Y31 product="hypothetical protein" protein_id=Seg3094.2/GoldUCD/D3Y31
MAHRHMVLVRTEKKEKAKAKVTMLEFQEESTANKSATHTALGDSLMWTVYTIAELKRLCAAYDIKLTSEIRRKIDIVKLLIPAVKTSNYFACSFYLDNLQVKPAITDNVNGPLRLTIRMMRS